MALRSPTGHTFIEVTENNMELQASALTQRYGKSPPIFTDLSFSLRDGVVALLGVNGAGKTTLLKTLVGILPAFSGQVTINGQQLSAQIRAGKLADISFLPQEVTFNPKLTVVEFITYIAWMRGVPLRKISAQIGEVLDSLDIANIHHHRMGSLSGGQVRRCGLASAIIGTPQVLILDEPTAGLDPEQRVAIRTLISQHLAPLTILSTHLLEDVVRVADRVLVLDAGSIIFDGNVAQLEALATAHRSAGTSLAESGFLHLVRHSHPAETITGVGTAQSASQDHSPTPAASAIPGTSLAESVGSTPRESEAPHETS
ncbi:ABC-type multidrug transport system, ATPase component [Actinobaculum suis]|uniref:ABC-type multidrug transport system, ATPase component n=1 Tax=Actinobaculum suis TaxID=1657 RepID=A0A1G7AIU7_9ACTO|nr:ATP-binding cassette domain-containing protein [Actinobaculum suis]SDE13796.1 ABC-type multidrug transport system, ATPase component [Actinobaculum suis]